MNVRSQPAVMDFNLDSDLSKKQKMEESFKTQFFFSKMTQYWHVGPIKAL